MMGSSAEGRPGLTSDDRNRALAFRACSSSFTLRLIPDLLSQGTQTIPQVSGIYLNSYTLGPARSAHTSPGHTPEAATRERVWPKVSANQGIKVNRSILKIPVNRKER